jgi:hypothetical protein
MTIERVTQLIKGGFAYRADRELGFHPPFWQKGFSETGVFDANSFANHVEYNHSNPVTRHLVVQAEHYRYSSVYQGFELDSPPQRLKPVQLEQLCGTPEGVP